jgi:UDP-glucose 4-epimerase
MRVLVTGGAGFIGFHTCSQLLKQGHQVIVLDDLSTGKITNIQDLARDELTFIKGDILDDEALINALDGVDSVIHLAAKVSVRESIDNPSLTSRTNVHGFINVADKARLLGVKRIVYASSAAIYGDVQGAVHGYGWPTCHPAWHPRPDHGQSTDDPEAVYQPISPYGLDKLTDERYAALFNKLYGIQTIGLRYFNVYGPRQDPTSHYAGVIGKFISLALSDQPLTIFGDGEQCRNFVYVDDIARVNVAAATGQGGFANFQGFVNVAKPDGVVTLNQMVRKLNKIIGKPIAVNYVDPVVGDIRTSIPQLNMFVSLFDEHSSMRPLDEGLVHLVDFLKS